MFPVVYTPTEADAIADYSHLFRRSEGLYLTPPGEKNMEEDFLDACEGRELELASVLLGTEELMTDDLTDRRFGWRSNFRYRRPRIRRY